MIKDRTVSSKFPSPGIPPKLNATQQAFVGRIVEGGPIPAIGGEPVTFQLVRFW